MTKTLYEDDLLSDLVFIHLCDMENSFKGFSPNAELLPGDFPWKTFNCLASRAQKLKLSPHQVLQYTLFKIF